jgi:hypothetical protein
MYQIDEEFRAEVECHKWNRMRAGYWQRNNPRRGSSHVAPRLMHRFVWLLKHGTLPPILDHINGDRQDNRIANLRPATPSLNAINRKTRRNGVTPVDNQIGPNRWQASIGWRGKSKYLGCFPTKEAADEYYFSCRAKIMEYEEALIRGESPEPPVIERVRQEVERRGRPAKKFAYAPARVVELYTSGRSTASICRELAVREDHIRACLKAAGIKLRRGQKPRPKPSGFPSNAPSSLAILMVVLVESPETYPAWPVPVD